MNTLESLTRATIAPPEESLHSLDRAESKDAKPQSDQSLWPAHLSRDLIQLLATPNRPAGANAPSSQNLTQLLAANFRIPGNVSVGTSTSALTANGNTLPNSGSMPCYI